MVIGLMFSKFWGVSVGVQYYCLTNSLYRTEWFSGWFCRGGGGARLEEPALSSAPPVATPLVASPPVAIPLVASPPVAIPPVAPTLRQPIAPTSRCHREGGVHCDATGTLAVCVLGPECLRSDFPHPSPDAPPMHFMKSRQDSSAQSPPRQNQSENQNRG